MGEGNAYFPVCLSKINRKKTKKIKKGMQKRPAMLL